MQKCCIKPDATAFAEMGKIRQVELKMSEAVSAEMEKMSSQADISTGDTMQGNVVHSLGMIEYDITRVIEFNHSCYIRLKLLI